MMTTNVFGEEKNILAGEDRFETAITISNSWKKSQEAILVNSTATSDLLCATVLSSQIDCPILLTDKNKINESTINEIKRLNVNKLYLIGGADVINESIEKELNRDSIKTERISGENRYETSINVANKINKLKKLDTVILVNGEYSVADAVSISPVAGNKNIPVIICKDKEAQIQIEWMESNNIKNSYIIGGEDVIHETIENGLKNNNINTKRIYGKDRYETNAKVIENFYKESTINKIFYCKGKDLNKKDEIVDGMLAAPLASKEKAPIILLGENLSKEQKDIIKTKDIKNLIQVGYGISEEAKEELYKIKESYNPPNLDNLPSRPITPEKPSDPIIPPSDEGSNVPQEILPSDEDNSNLPEVTPPKDDEDSNVSPVIPPLDEENSIQPEEIPQIENLKYVNYIIDDDKKNIIINFNKDIYTSKVNVKELKDSIMIIIDKNNIKNNQDSEEKYIKLNKYDNVKIEGQSLIIELDDELIGNNSSIVISKDTIKDYDNNYLEELRIENIKGINKNIVFVKTEEEFDAYRNDKEVDIIKLENDIEISKDILIRLKNNITIDGSNGEDNFRIYNLKNSLQQILMSSNNITLKNLDLENIYVEIINRQNIILKNMKIDLNNKKISSSTIFTLCVIVNYSEVELKDLILTNNENAIKVNSTSPTGKRATLTIDGYVYNEKTDEEGNYKPSIILENRSQDIENNKLNNIIIKDKNNNIEDLYNKETININENGTIIDKYYELYYKKVY